MYQEKSRTNARLSRPGIRATTTLKITLTLILPRGFVKRSRGNVAIPSQSRASQVRRRVTPTPALSR